MKNCDINEFEINNNPIASLDVNNSQLSDELNVDELNSNPFGNSFANSKRVSSIFSKVTIFSSLSVTLISGSFYISNSLVKNDPLINNFNESFVLENNVLKYTLDISLNDTYLELRITNNEENIYKETFKESKIYEASIELIYGYDYVVNFYSTNEVDYEKLLDQYTLTYHVEEK